MCCRIAKHSSRKRKTCARITSTKLSRVVCTRWALVHSSSMRILRARPSRETWHGPLFCRYLDRFWQTCDFTSGTSVHTSVKRRTVNGIIPSPPSHSTVHAFSICTEHALSILCVHWSAVHVQLQTKVSSLLYSAWRRSTPTFHTSARCRQFLAKTSLARANRARVFSIKQSFSSIKQSIMSSHRVLLRRMTRVRVAGQKHIH